MRNVTFALYPDMPIACEGDDVDARVITLKIRHDLERFEHAVSSLTRRYGGFVQIWDICKVA